jgi:hypothetical protein
LRYAHAERTPEKSPSIAAPSLPSWKFGCSRSATPAKPSAIATKSQLEKGSRSTTVVAMARKIGEV